MRTGRIKWFNSMQNHGYIVLWDGTEVYFHGSGVMGWSYASHLNPGTDVSFDIIQTRTGLEAQNIEIIG